MPTKVRRTMWGVVNTPRHWIYGVEFTRRRSIEEFLKDYGKGTWRQKRKEGWRCVRLTISYETD